MPYNYLIDDKIRRNFSINYQNSVIIFDEAHNIARCAEDVTSFELTSSNLKRCLLEIHSLKKIITGNVTGNGGHEWRTNSDALRLIERLTENFYTFICEYSLDPADNPDCIRNVLNNPLLPRPSIVLPGAKIFDIFFEGTKFSGSSLGG